MGVTVRGSAGAGHGVPITSKRLFIESVVPADQLGGAAEPPTVMSPVVWVGASKVKVAHLMCHGHKNGGESGVERGREAHDGNIPVAFAVSGARRAPRYMELHFVARWEPPPLKRRRRAQQVVAAFEKLRGQVKGQVSSSSSVKR